MELFSEITEQAIFGCCFLDEKILDEVTEFNEDYFYLQSSKRMLKMIKHLKVNNIPPSSATCEKWLKADAELSELYYKCHDSLEMIDLYPSHKNELIDLWTKRKLHLIGLDMSMKDLTMLNAKEVISELSGQLESLTPEQKKDKCERILEIYKRYGEARLRGQEMCSGMKTFDDEIYGFKRELVYILGGIPGSGKTCFALFLAQKIAFQDNKKVLFFSLEMSEYDLVGRLTSMLYGVPQWKIQKTWHMSDEEFDCLKKAGARIDDTNLEIEDESLTIDEIVSAVKLKKPDIVFIDHLQHIPAPVNTKEKQHEYLTRYLRRLQDLAKKEKFCLFMISHLRRNDSGGKIHQPKLTDFAGTSGIERQAEICLAIYRPEKKNMIDAPREGYFEMLILKNRNGSPAKVKMEFNKDNLTYKEYI